MPIPTHRHTDDLEGGKIPSTSIDGLGLSLAISVGTEANDTITVTVQVSERAPVWVYLSESASGDGVAGAPPTGGATVTVGDVIAEPNASLVWVVVPDALGQVVIDIVQAGARTLYLVVLDSLGNKTVSDPISFA